MTRAALESLGALIRRRTGLALRDAREHESLKRFVDGRLRALGLSSSSEYVELLARQRAGGKELGRVVAAITNPHTFFYRDQGQMLAFLSLARKALAERGGQGLSLWSAGCATGEEAYTLAMLCEEEGIPARVVATDVNPEVLRIAEQGRYHEWSLRRCPPRLVERWFEREPNGVLRVSEGLRARVEFRRHNLVEEAFPVPIGPEGWDFVFCRNVLLYFEREVIERVLDGFARVLAPEGWLLLGTAEHLHGLRTVFAVTPVEGSFACRRGDVGGGAPVARRSLDPAASPAPGARTTLPRRSRSTPPLQARTSSVEGPPRAEAPQLEARSVEAPRDRASRARATQVREEVVALLDDREREAAVRRLEEHLGADPHDWWAWVTLGNLELREHRFDEALHAYDRALELGLLSAEVHYLTGVVYRKLGDVPRAIHAFRQALFLDPTFWRAAFMLAGLYGRSGDEAARRRYLVRTRALLDEEQEGPSFSSYVAGMQDVLIDREQAISLCRRYLAEDDTSLSPRR